MAMKAAFGLLLAGAAAAPAPALANPLDAFGFGARSIALGGAVTATASDFSANYYNPAGLAAGEDLRLELGYTYVAPTLELGAGDVEVDPSRGFQGGIVLPGRLLGRRVGVSVGLFLPDAQITRVRSLPQTQPRFVLFDNRPQRLIVSASAAFELLEDLYLGAGLTFISDTRGTLEMQGVVSLKKAEESTLLTAVDVRFPAVRYPTFGLLWTPGEHWRFGLSYRHEYALDLDLGVRVQGDVVFKAGSSSKVVVEDGSFLVTSLNRNLFSPRQVTLGAAYADPAFSVAFDLTWLQWSRFPPPTSRIGLELDLGDLDFEIPVPAIPADPGFHDILVPRLGGELRVLNHAEVVLRLRLGYFFEPSPAPDQPGETNYVDGDKHGVSVGLGIELPGLQPLLPKPLHLDLALQVVALAPRRYEKTDPADMVGDFEASGIFLGASITAGFLF